MRQFVTTALVCLCAGLLLSGAGPARVYAQTQNPTANDPAGNRLADKPADPTAVRQVGNLESSAEQMARDARTFQQNLQQQLAGLQAEIADGQFMNAEDLAKLKAFSEAFGSEKSALESRAAELSEHARVFAAQAAHQSAQIQEQAQTEAQAVAPMAIAIANEDDSGWLGIEIQEVTPENAKDLKLKTVRGVVVQGVEPYGPAAKAGLKEGDVITDYDGQVVEGTLQFRRLVRETPPGRTVTMTISRDGSQQNVTVELGDRSAVQEKQIRGAMNDLGNSYWLSGPGPDTRFFAFGPEGFDRTTPRLGIEAEDLSGQLGAYFGAPDDSGVLVRSVGPGSPAEKAGLKAGDVITKVNGKDVKTLSDLREDLRSNANQKSVEVSVLRKGSAVNLTVAIEKPEPTTSSHIIRRAQM